MGTRYSLLLPHATRPVQVHLSAATMRTTNVAVAARIGIITAHQLGFAVLDTVPA